jgi:hypothetical protein
VSKYFSHQRDVHATVSKKSAGGMPQIMESDVWETSFDTRRQMISLRYLRRQRPRYYLLFRQF